jgi:hypothetical protein
MYEGGYLIGKGITCEDLALNFTQIKDGCDKDTMKWHLRFGHSNLQIVKLMKTK